MADIPKSQYLYIMMTSEYYTIQLTLEQKLLFDKWLKDVEKELEVKLASIKSLRRQTSQTSEAAVPEKESRPVKSQDQSWTSKTFEVIRNAGYALTSTEIIAWLMEHDKELQGRDKRYITKNVTSKLVILVDKGRLEKHMRYGKNVYSVSNNS
jgi:hypothetical protein